MNLFGTGPDRICGVAAAKTAMELRVLVGKALRETRTVELRLDWLRDDAQRHSFLKWLKKALPKSKPLKRAIFIATCRRSVGGGEFSGDAGAELYWLIQAREAGCAWCDLELETLRELPQESIRGFQVPEKVLLSMHDFRRTPPLPKKFNLPKHTGADGVKLAAMAVTLQDSLRLLQVARVSRGVVAVPMGEIGMPARILALREGSALAYGAVRAATAPGQVSLSDLKNLYRADKITAKTRVFGVIGNPIGHSLSPLLHNTGYVAAKKDAVFLPFLVEKLADFLKALAEFGVDGFSVTLPHKKTIFRYLADCEPLAEEIGAVNTVTVGKNGKLKGINTDYLGVLRALEPKIKLKGSRAVIFGAGGSARAAAFALAKAGAEVLICARRESAAKELARAVKGSVLPRAALLTEKFDLLVNATPVGMFPQAEVSPLSAAELNCSLVMDLIYRPMQTKLLRLAAGKGLQTVSGVEMFVAQGVAQWEHWMKSRAPEAAMRRAVFNLLQSKEKSRW